VTARNARDVDVCDLVDVFTEVADEVSFADLLVVDIIEEPHVRAVYRVGDLVPLVGGGEVDPRMVDARVDRFDQQRYVGALRLSRDASQRRDDGAMLDRRIDRVVPSPRNDV
jgi:hypothetical protein